ncbi:MnmC family methyltransferase [Arcobacteraceae bacterium]|nr:MnmC family methyltransferase [Arcobacteraceae bacterium]
MIPAFEYHHDKKELNILDICFGLGYNTLATLYYIKKNHLDIKVNIFSPEFDEELLSSLINFNYPEEFTIFSHIIQSLSNTKKYKDKNITIEIFNGDAREYIRTIYNLNKIKFDIVYQDAFSSEVNHLLWTVEYFKEISNILSSDAILTTYSIATPIRLSIYQNSFTIYEYKPLNSNRITIALNKKVLDSNFKHIDMELKKERNKTANALFDRD